jgi:Tfp pilus assembly protein PilF
LECLPPALRFAVEDGVVTDRPVAEPLAADIRQGGDDRRDARLKVVAGMLGVGLDELRQRDQARRQKRLAAIGVAATIGCAVLAGLAIAALLARNEAEALRRIAEQKSLTAERTADFMISLFQVADPGEARGNSITAREILDRGVRQIDQSLRDEPQVRAELTTTLGEVYTGLGLYNPALELLNKARAVSGQSIAAALHQAVSLAELEFQRGNDRRADELLAEADRVARAEGEAIDPALRARLLLARGDVAAVLEQDAEAQKYFGEALAIGRQRNLDDVIARALEGLGLSSYYAGDLAAAERWYSQALASRIAHSGESHPRASETLNALGSIAYMRDDSKNAEKYWLRSLGVDRRVLGDAHPNLATTLNNLGRLHVERREFERARGYLVEAVQIHSATVSESHDGRIFALTNLGLVMTGLEDYAEAEALLLQSLPAAVATKHRLEGPILTDLADLECRTGRPEAGLRRLETARPIVAARYPDDPWRVALVDNVRAGCLGASGRAAEAVPLIAGSLPTVLAKWPGDTYYGHDALERARRVYTLTDDRAALASLPKS